MLTKHVGSYKANTKTAQAARQYKEAGVKVHPGEAVNYVIADEKTETKTQKAQAVLNGSKVKYHADSYIKLLTDALKELGL